MIADDIFQEPLKLTTSALGKVVENMPSICKCIDMQNVPFKTSELTAVSIERLRDIYCRIKQATLYAKALINDMYQTSKQSKVEAMVFLNSPEKWNSSQFYNEEESGLSSVISKIQGVGN